MTYRLSDEDREAPAFTDRLSLPALVERIVALEVAAETTALRERQEFPLSLEDTQQIVDHLIHDGTREGLLLGDLLNRAMGASTRRRAASGEARS